MAEIELHEITKTFGDVVAINRLSFSVHDHEFLVMLGPSGAGKTTTLRTVAGLEKPEHGRLLIDGSDLTHQPPSMHGVAFVFQNYALYPFMTVRENMTFPLKADRAMRRNKPEMQRRVTEIAALLQIERLLERKPTQLSGGQQQRVALGRAMVRNARAFLMDEPLTNLDAKLRSLMRSELKHLQRRQGSTTLYVTHDQVEAMTMGDRILVLKKGEIQQIGTPNQIYNEPANLFVAKFVGNPHMNLVPVTPSGNGGVIVSGYDSPVLLTGRILRAFERAERRDLTLGVRAEDITLAANSQPGYLPAPIYAVEPLGDRTVYDLNVGTAIIKAKAPARFLMEIGTTLWFKIDSDRTHLFDSSTELRIDPGMSVQESSPPDAARSVNG